MQKKIVTFGEIMLRLSTPGFSRFTQAEHFNATYGGGEANVTISLANFGMAAEHVTRFPDHGIGYAATQLLRKNNVLTDHIVYGGDRIGIYYLETGAAMRASKVVYDRNNSSFAQIKPGDIDWNDVLKDAQWFHWTGITPAISQGAADSCLEAIKTANKLGVTVSADINYRKNLWQYGKSVKEVMPALVEGCDLIIASKNDIVDIFGLEGEKGEKYVSLCKQLMEKFPRIKKISTTKRESISASHNAISAVLWEGKELITSAQHHINPIIDRIGGGDAFMAGLIYGLVNYNDNQKALDFGIAASALKHTIEGDANLATVSEVEALVSGDNTGKLVR